MTVIWPLAVLGFGSIATATLLGVTWWAADWVSSSWTIWNWLVASMLLIGPYVLCTTGLWFTREPGAAQFSVRVLAGVVVLGGVLGLLSAYSVAKRFHETGIPLGILVHLWLAFLVLIPQYAAAVAGVILAWLGRSEASRVAPSAPN